MNDLEEQRLLYPRVTEIIGKQNQLIKKYKQFKDVVTKNFDKNRPASDNRASYIPNKKDPSTANKILNLFSPKAAYAQEPDRRIPDERLTAPEPSRRTLLELLREIEEAEEEQERLLEEQQIIKETPEIQQQENKVWQKW